MMFSLPNIDSKHHSKYESHSLEIKIKQYFGESIKYTRILKNEMLTVEKVVRYCKKLLVEIEKGKYFIHSYIIRGCRISMKGKNVLKEK